MTDMQCSQEKHRVYRSLEGRNGMFGCDRELFMSNVLMFVTVCVTSVDFRIALPAFVLFALIFLLLYRMGRHDLLLRKLYLRQRKYAPYSRAQAVFSAKAGNK